MRYSLHTLLILMAVFLPVAWFTVVAAESAPLLAIFAPVWAGAFMASLTVGHVGRWHGLTITEWLVDLAIVALAIPFKYDTAPIWPARE